MKSSGAKASGSGALSLLRSAWKGRRGATGAARPAVAPGDRDKLLQVMRLGCPRTTAAKYVGLSGEQLDELLLADEELARDLLRAEADAEVRHMGNVHKASTDEKNWRTSVWWLEQHGLNPPEAAAAGPEYPDAIAMALEKFAELIITEVPDVTRRQSLLTKLLHIAVETVTPAVVIDVEAAALPGASGGEDGRENVDSPAILAGRPARMAGLCNEEAS